MHAAIFPEFNIILLNDYTCIVMKLFSPIILTAVLFVSCEKNKDSDPQFKTETISMGTNSSNDIYYSLETGVISSEARNQWDIAFSTPLQSATVLINEGAGVELYAIEDTSHWAEVPEYTARNQRFNNESDWDSGAFNQFNTGFPNYGWGTYHAGMPNHDVGGDSIYVIKLTDGSYKKFMIRVKLGAGSENIIRWANLDGTMEQTARISTTPYANKNFIHFSIVDHAIREIEPDNWDLLFTRYLIKVPSGPNTYMQYPVTGVLTHPGIETAKVTGLHPDEATDASSIEGYESRADVIGSDWKATDPDNHANIFVIDSISYFIQNEDGTRYQLYFTGYSGFASGSLDFKIKKVD